MAKKLSPFRPPVYSFDREAVLGKLNLILEAELAAVVRCTHYAMMIFGYNRIPIVSWLRKRADESLEHAQQAGELITHFGGHPSLAIGPLLETHRHDIGDILRELYMQEQQVTGYYNDLLTLVQNKSVMLEDYARKMVSTEEEDLGEVDKMLRTPGEIERFTE